MHENEIDHHCLLFGVLSHYRWKEDSPYSLYIALVESLVWREWLVVDLVNDKLLEVVQLNNTDGNMIKR